jgi:hypothetical protein
MKTQTPTEMQMQASPPRAYLGAGVKRAKRVKVKRIKSLCLRLSFEEHQMVRGKARAAGMTASALLRDHLGRAQIYNHKQTQIWLATLLSIRKVLVTLAERAVVFQPAAAAATIAYLASIARQLEQFEHLEHQYARKVLP